MISVLKVLLMQKFAADALENLVFCIFYLFFILINFSILTNVHPN